MLCGPSWLYETNLVWAYQVEQEGILRSQMTFPLSLASDWDRG